MGFRFRKSISLGKLLKLNVSKSGIGVSGGIRGARLSVSPDGKVRGSVGLPGTGVSYTKVLGDITPSDAKKKAAAPPTDDTMGIPPAAASAAKRFCTACGKRAAAKDKFCRYCGARVPTGGAD